MILQQKPTWGRRFLRAFVGHSFLLAVCSFVMMGAGCGEDEPSSSSSSSRRKRTKSRAKAPKFSKKPVREYQKLEDIYDEDQVALFRRKSADF